MTITTQNLFAWIRANQPDKRLTQNQVDAVNSLLSFTDIGNIAETLSNLNRWDKIVLDTQTSNREYNLTYENLKKAYPKVNPNAIPFILKYAPVYGINTKKQMCSFLATCIIESNGFNAKRESFAYSPTRLLQVFPRSRIPNLNFATNLVAKGQKEIANHLYNGRMGNRLGTDDGWRYRGNSWIQLTGRDNHYAMQRLTGIPVGDNPELLEIIENACIVTMAWWKANGLNEKSELINVYSDGYTLNTLDARGRETKNYKFNTGAVAVRKAVNGGLNGFDDFCRILEKCFKYL